MSAKTLFLDVETLPIHAAVWGLWGVNVGLNQIIRAGRTTCIAWKWGHSKQIGFAGEWEYFDTSDKGGEGYKQFLQVIHDLLDEADIVVTYNGIKFDIPTLYKEFVQHSLPPPSPFRQVDLYRVVKSRFRFASSKLDFICQQLGLGAKTQHKGMSLWNEVEAGCPKARRVMERYNRQDVKLLEKLYVHLRPWIKNHPNLAMYGSKEGAVSKCPTCGSDKLQSRGYIVTNTRRYQRHHCQSCGTWSKSVLCDKEAPKPEVTSV